MKRGLCLLEHQLMWRVRRFRMQRKSWCRCKLTIIIDWHNLMSCGGLYYFLHFKIQANKFMPRTHGDGVIHASHVDAIFFEDAPLYQRLTEAASVWFQWCAWPSSDLVRLYGDSQTTAARRVELSVDILQIYVNVLCDILFYVCVCKMSTARRRRHWKINCRKLGCRWSHHAIRCVKC